MSRHFCTTPTILLLVFAVDAWANVGKPNTGGKAAGEPAGIKDIIIERETLMIDLRPLAQKGAVQVEAVYGLNNNGTAQTLELVFAMGSVAEKFHVTLDGVEIGTQPDANPKLPSTWKSPTTTPMIPGRGASAPLAYSPRSDSPRSFTLTIPTGRHVLKTAYLGEAGTHLYGDPTVFRQFAYVLAPAREWAGFGGLDLTIHLPPGWHAATNLELAREGDTLTGTFATVPDDSLTITVQAQEGAIYPVAKWGSLALFVLTLVVGLFVCWRTGQRHGRRGTPAWPWAILLGVLYGMAVFVVGLVAIFGPDWALDGQASNYGYGPAFAAIGLMLLAGLMIPVGFVICQVTAVVVRSMNAARVAR